MKFEQAQISRKLTQVGGQARQVPTTVTESRIQFYLSIGLDKGIHLNRVNQISARL